MVLNCPPWLEKILKFTCLKWLKMVLNYPPWLEKILKFTCLKWLKMVLNCPSWLEKSLKFTLDFSHENTHDRRLKSWKSSKIFSRSKWSGETNFCRSWPIFCRSYDRWSAVISDPGRVSMTHFILTIVFSTTKIKMIIIL